MPIYEYKCSNCGHQFEKIQKFSDKPSKVCPKCSTDGLKKLISSPSFRLKGSGWYETDFKTGTKKNLVDSNDNKKSKINSNKTAKKDNITKN
ncbi:MAG: FmdB family zinc ribbon protein [Gammaproteobacteria bacterium]